MKVVLFCGGQGARIREYSEAVPKPMIPIGYRPLLWHLMKYYAHHGHKDFILCLGYKGDVIKNYFRNYDECVSNNFILSEGGKNLQLLSSDIHDWKITFVDTGLLANIGQRLQAVQPYLEGEGMFLANYSDGLTDLALPEQIEAFRRSGKVGGFLAVPPPQSYHVVSLEGNQVKGIAPINRAGIWINGGFFIFRSDIFDYLREGEELVDQPFKRLIAEDQLCAHPYEGFFACMDTFKDKQRLEDLFAAGNAPWEVWKKDRASGEARCGRKNEAVVDHA